MEIISYAIVYGKIQARHVMVTDITNRKLAEEALSESEEQLKAIFENSINPIVVADDAGNYFKVNQAAAKMFQYPVGQLLQMNVGDLHTTTSRVAATRYQEYISKGFGIGEFDIIQPDRTEAFAQYHAVQVRENFNLSILSDITERKQAERDLQELEIARNTARFKLYEPGKFDLILMDIQMPVMNGIKATHILKERFIDLPPVIGLSANAFEGDREKYMDLGMDEYLAKPVKRDDFQEMLQHFLVAIRSLRRIKPSFTSHFINSILVNRLMLPLSCANNNYYTGASRTINQI